MSEKQRQTWTESIQRQENQPLSPEQQQRFEREKQEIIMLSKVQRNSLSNEVISSYLKNYHNIDLSKYSPEIQKKFVEEVSMLFEEFKNFDTSMITSLRSIREWMSFGIEEWKSDEFYRNMIIWNALQTRILAIKIFLNNTKWENIQIDGKSYNKFDYNSYRSDIQKIDAHLWVDMLNSIDVKRNNINLKRVFSDRISQQIDPSNRRYNLIMADITRLPNVIWNKWFENLRSVKLKNGKTVDLGQIFNMYNYVYTSFQWKNSVFQSWNRQINESKKWLWLNESKYWVWYNKIKDTYKDKFEEIDIENMWLADLIIMMRVIFSVIPVAWDSVWWYDDMKQALAWVNFDGSMQGLWENVFMHLIGWLQLSIVWWWFAKLAKWPKLAKAMSTLWKIVDKISKSPEMLQDLARNERVMKMLEGMKALWWDLWNKVNDILINLQQKNGMILNIHENNQLAYRWDTTIYSHDLSRLTKVDNPNDKMIDRSWMKRPIKKENLNFTQEQIRRILRDFKDMWTPPKESPQDMRDRLTRKRKWWARDPEHILDIAKQQGAVLLREWEKLMRANPWIPWTELWQLIRKRADELWIKITPTQGKIIDAQMRQYDAVLDDYWRKNKREFIKNNPLDAFKQLIPELWYFDDKLFLLASAEYLKHNPSLDSETKDMVRIFTGELNDPEYFARRNITRKDVIDKFWPYLWIKFDTDTFPWVIVVKTPHEIHNTLWVESIDDYTRWLVTGDSFWLYQHNLPWFLFINKKAWIDTIEHEYQHFLDNIFLNPILLPWTIWNSRKSLAQNEKRYGRILQEPTWLSEKIWKSMQGELCSYIERNWILPKSIEPYLSSTLKSKLQNWEIPEKHIQDMEDTIRSLETYFDSPLVPRDVLVWIIRTSHSIEDMLARLRKNFGTLIKVQDTTKATDLYWLEPWNRVRNIPLPD